MVNIRSNSVKSRMKIRMLLLSLFSNIIFDVPASASPTSGACSNLSIEFQSFPASGSFPMSWLFASDGQNIGASASVLPMNIQGWFPLGLTGLNSVQSKGLSRVFSSTTVQRHQFFDAQSFFIFQLSHPYMTTGNTITLAVWTFEAK